MRLWSSLKSKLTRTHRIITLTPLTTAFFVFTFITCLVQALIHSLLYSVDQEYSVLLTRIIKTADIPPRNFTNLVGQHVNDYWSPSGTGKANINLLMCNDTTAAACYSLYQTQQKLEFAPLHDPKIHNAISSITRSPRNQNTEKMDTWDTPSVNLTAGQYFTLSRLCTSTLTYPQQHLHNATREDLALLFIQFWLFAMGMYAVIFDSVGHIIAPLLARTLLLAWSFYALFRTHHQGLVFDQLIERPGSPCSLALFSSSRAMVGGLASNGYFHARFAYEISDLILNFAAWLIAMYLSWTLMQVYETQSSSCVGASKSILRTYKYHLALLCTIHLSLFVMPATFILLADQVLNSFIRANAAHFSIYMGGFILACVLTVPHLVSGHRALLAESRRTFAVFCGITFIFMFAFCLGFYSQVYRYMFLLWPHLGCYIVATMILTFAMLVLSGFILLRGFGKGVKEWRHAERALSAQNFSAEVFDHDTEKASPIEENDKELFPETDSVRKLKFLSQDLTNPYTLTNSPDENTSRIRKISIVTAGLPMIRPGQVVSPTIKTTAQIQREQGIVAGAGEMPVPLHSGIHREGLL